MAHDPCVAEQSTRDPSTPTEDKTASAAPMSVLVYMTSWCSDCSRSRRVLRRLGIPFREIDIDEVDGAEEEMRALNGGSGKVPTIIIDGTVLVEPRDWELMRVLQSEA